MGVFPVFLIAQMVPNRATHHIFKVAFYPSVAKLKNEICLHEYVLLIQSIAAAFQMLRDTQKRKYSILLINIDTSL